MSCHVMSPIGIERCPSHIVSYPCTLGQVWKERLEREQKEVMSLTGDDRERAEKLAKDKKVHPVDAPKGSLRARLLRQMTATESSSKTAVSDLLFNLCADEGASEYYTYVVLAKHSTINKFASPNVS